MDDQRSLVASDGTRLAYWLRRAPERPESSPVLLLLHGAASNHTRWSEFLDQTSLTASMDVLCPDLRGNGASMTRGRLDREVWSRDLLDLLDAEGYRRALIAGHSLGAQIALHFGHRHPDRTAGLVLIDPIFKRALTGPRKRMGRVMPLFTLVTWVVRALNAIGFERSHIEAERDLRALDEETRAALRGGESHAEIARRYSALGPILRHMPVANYLQQLRATVADVGPIETLDMPVLVLLSTGITFADPEINRAEIERFPRVSTVAIEANHWPLTERPLEVRRAIEDWIAGELPALSDPGRPPRA